MKFCLPTAQIYVPDGLPVEQALARTTHMAIGAHQDDLEFMAVDGVLKCFQQPAHGFTGVVVTNGSGSPRDGLYRSYTDEQMRQVRIQEQKKAACVGEYAAQALLDHPSSAVKDGKNKGPVEDLQLLLQAARPRVVYTHSLADKHDTHVAVALRVIAALRSLRPVEQPESLYGCEVWRNLDWMPDHEKVIFDVSAHENLQMALMGVFDSQISGGKRYDLATQGRRKANATYLESHATDVATASIYAMDMTPLMRDTTLDPLEFVQGFIQRFAAEVASRIIKFR